MASLSLVAAARATDMAGLIDRLPRGYVGEFRWHDEHLDQNVTIVLDSVRALSDTKAEAVGCGVYKIQRREVRIKVRMFVRLPDLAIEMWEQAAQGDAGFETNGSHRGHLSDDLRHLDAQWTSQIGGRTGQLHLQAVESAVCEPALAT